MTWIAEFRLAWSIDGNRVPGRIAIGMPELVRDTDRGDLDYEGEATCTIALDGLQSRPTTVHGEGRFHALMIGVRFIDAQIRGHVAKGVRVLLLGDADDADDPEGDTEFLLAMFKPFDASSS